MKYIVFIVVSFVLSFSMQAFLGFAFDKPVELFTPIWWAIVMVSSLGGWFAEQLVEE